jgi:hypothetical protein
MRIDGNGSNPHLGGRQRVVRDRIARILDPDLGVPIEEDADCEVDGRLRAAGDNDLFGLASHRPRGSQIVAEGLPQFWKASGVGVAEMERTKRADGLVGELPPRLDRARIHPCAPHIERPRI